MSTEQAAYALVAYDRYKNNKKPLYDMSDVFDGPTDGTDTDHPIHASADAGGTISPVGDVTVPDGAKQSFTVTPNEGYQIEDILGRRCNRGAETRTARIPATHSSR